MKPLKPPATLLMGPAGSGKTSSLATFGLAGIETFVLFTEPRGEESLIDSIARTKAPLELFHWHTVTAPPAGWDALRKMVLIVKNTGHEDIAKMKAGIEKSSMVQLEAFLNAIADFPDDRTGECYGDVTTWDDKRAFCVDSLTGLNDLAWLTTIGYKPTAHQGEWGVAMNLEKEFIYKLTADCGCYFVLTAHLDREPDAILGTTKIVPAALGNKLAPKLTPRFGEVIRTYRRSNGFSWSNAEDGADLKNRALPISSNLQPDFRQLVSAYEGRKKLLMAPAPEEKKPE